MVCNATQDYASNVVQLDRDDGTYNIEFDDKELFKEFKVPPSRIRKVRDEREAVTEMERRRGV